MAHEFPFFFEFRKCGDGLYRSITRDWRFREEFPELQSQAFFHFTSAVKLLHDSFMFFDQSLHTGAFAQSIPCIRGAQFPLHGETVGYDSPDELHTMFLAIPFPEHPLKKCAGNQLGAADKRNKLRKVHTRNVPQRGEKIMTSQD